MNSFDAKINTENLTKCLQTLKQFYGDLYKDKVTTTVQINTENFTQDSVLPLFQTTRGSSKILRYASYFKFPSRPLEMWSDTVFSV